MSNPKVMRRASLSFICLYFCVISSSYNSIMAELTEAQIEIVRVRFNEFDMDGNGQITTAEIGGVMEALGETVPGYKLREIVREVDTNMDGTVSFVEFLDIYKKSSSPDNSLLKDLAGISIELEEVPETTVSGYSVAEEAGFADWMNSVLKDDPDCAGYLPIKTTDRELIEKCKDGVLLCKLISKSVPKSIDERAINQERISMVLMTENLLLAINSARAIGCSVDNIGPDDVITGRANLVLGLVWQIIQIGLFTDINIDSNPNLVALLAEGETIEDMRTLSPEEILLRWVNYNVQTSGSNRRCNNFVEDIKDSEIYLHLLNQIAPPEFGVTMDALQESDLGTRAEEMLKEADKLNCRKFVSAQDVCKGESKLNTAFVANLYKTYPSQLDAAEHMDEEFEPHPQTREEQTYCNWMNSLDVTPVVYSLYSDLSDGLVVFQLFDDIQKGVVDWDKVNQKPFTGMQGNMQKIENCNYAIELGKSMNFSLVGIGGEDLYSGSKTLTLAVVWQMMREYVMALLRKQTIHDKAVEDSEIIDWVNEKLRSSGKSSSISSFKDPSLSTGQSILDLVDAVKPGSVNYDLVTSGQTDEEKALNAGLAISLAKKIGVQVFAWPEDIVEVKPKMMLTLFTSIMTSALQAN